MIASVLPCSVSYSRQFHTLRCVLFPHHAELLHTFCITNINMMPRHYDIYGLFRALYSPESGLRILSTVILAFPVLPRSGLKILSTVILVFLVLSRSGLKILSTVILAFLVLTRSGLKILSTVILAFLVLPGSGLLISSTVAHTFPILPG